MALAICNTITDRNGRELLGHGTVAFPIACYGNDLEKEEVPWHWHEELEVIVIAEGSAVVAAGKETYTLQAGEGIFINAGVLHGMWSGDAAVCRFYSLVFHPRLIGGSIDSVFFQEYVGPVLENRGLESLTLRPSVAWQKAALETVETAWRGCAHEPRGYEFKVRSALSEFLFLIWDHIPNLQQSPGAKELRDGERIKRMLQYIHENYANEISTRQIAASALVSESECLRCFRSTIGTTPIQYVKQYRIQKAAHLLATTRDKVFDIAERCGFQDFSYFTRTFREMKGCVPTEYRRSTSLERIELCGPMMKL